MPARSNLPDRMEGRNGQVWQAYCAGETQEAVAQRFGLDQSTVSDILRKVAASLPAEDRAAVRVRMVEALNRMHAQMVELIDSPPIPAYSNGRPILDAAGRMVMDHTGRVNALKAALAVQDRMARLLGTDQPEQVAVTVSAQPVTDDQRISVYRIALAAALEQGWPAHAELIQTAIAALELGEVAEADRLEAEWMALPVTRSQVVAD